MEPISGDGPAEPEEPMKTRVRVALLWEHISALLQLRLRQAQGDARTAARRLVMGVVFGVVALALSLLALPLLVATVILALSTLLPAWLAAFVVLVGILLIVAGLLLIA